MAEDKTAPADKAGDGATELPATPEQTAETNEEAFGAAFEEFAAQDDTETPAAPDPGPEDEGQQGGDAPAKPTDQAASGEESSDDAADTAAPEGAAETQDIWADATPEQKAAFEAAQSKITATEHENVSHRTRASAQNRKINELMATPKPAADPAADKTDEPETDDEWEAVKTEYPEVIGPVEKRLKRLEEENAALRGQVTGITDAQTQDATNAEEALLTQRHPDYIAETSTPEFGAWLQKQPRYVQEGFARNGDAIVDGQEAASLIDLFKDSQSPESSKEVEKPSKDTATNGKVTRRQRRLESAVTTEGGQAGPGAGPPEGDFDASFDYFAAQP